MKILAYRGFLNSFPENTMTAFERTAQSGADGFLCDVQMLVDGTCIVHRDAKLGRCEKENGHIYDYRAENFKNIDVGESFSEEYKGEKIPLFEDVVSFAKQNNLFMGIEICHDSKPDYCFINEECPDKILNIIEKYNMKKNCFITSFNHSILLDIKNCGKGFETYITFLTDQNIDIAGYTKDYGFNGVHCHINYVTNEFIKKLKENNLSLSVLYGIT